MTLTSGRIDKKQLIDWSRSTRVIRRRLHQHIATVDAHCVFRCRSAAAPSLHGVATIAAAPSVRSDNIAEETKRTCLAQLLLENAECIIALRANAAKSAVTTELAENCSLKHMVPFAARRIK